MRSYHPIVHSLIIGTVLARAAASMSLPFLAIYLLHTLGITPSLIGLTIGVGALASTIGGFVGGALSDRIGRKKVMMSALYTWGIVFIGFALASHLWMFILLSFLNGLCRSFFEPVSQALMADLTKPEKRLHVFSLRYMAINIGVTLGPLIGAYFGLVAGSLPFIVTGIVYFLYAFSLQLLFNHFGIRKIEGKLKRGVTFREAWNVIKEDVSLRYYILGGILGWFSYSQMTVTLSQYVEGNFSDGLHLFAWLMSINALTVILLQIPLSKWGEHRSPLFNIIIGSCFYAMGNIGFALSRSWTLIILSMIIFTLGELLTFPSGDAFIDQLAKEGMRGTYFGAKTFTNFGQFIGPWIGGLLLTAYGGTALFLTVAMISLASIYFYWHGARICALQNRISLPLAQSRKV
ncbi:MDR family MFS transporter [Collibacillus ludicampi]|nr:MFS transporter [Collibacillus ludicampi]